MAVDFKTHLFTYRHDGADWVLAIQATSAEDARARIGKLAYATYDGEAVYQLSAKLGPAAYLAVWARNAAVALLPRFLISR